MDARSTNGPGSKRRAGPALAILDTAVATPVEAGNSGGSGSGGLPARRNRAGGRGQNSRTDATLNNFHIADPDLRRAFLTLAKSVTQLQQHDRQIRAATFTAMEITVGEPIQQALKDEYDRYVAAMQAGTLDPQASPQMFLFPTFVDSLAKMDVGARNKQVLQEYADTMFNDEMDPTSYPLIFMGKMHDNNKTRLMIDLRNDQHRLTVIQSIKQLNYTVRAGTAPRGWLEDQHSQMITKVQQ